MPAPVVVTALLVTCPESSVIRQDVIVEARHLLRQLEILILQRIGIDTFLAVEINDIDLRRVAINLNIRTLRTTVILVDRTVAACVIGILRHTVVIRHHLYTRLLLRYEIEVIILSLHG